MIDCCLQAAVWLALETYWMHKDSWKGIMLRGMKKDFSWGAAAERYEMTCHWAKIDEPFCK